MKIYLASGNEHKLEEFTKLIHKFRLPIQLESANSVGGMPEVEESGETLDENARIKGNALLERVPAGSWVLSDDSGLIVDALDGAPGVHSARFAGHGANAVANNIKLLLQLKGVPLDERTARFSCVLYFSKVAGDGQLFKGTCEGHIMPAPSGVRGFGYDPLFRPLGYTKTFADLGSAVKNNLSHRAKAVMEWAEFLKRELD